MLIDCPTCARSYQVSRSAIGAEGRTVVCPGCQARWYVAAPRAETVDHPVSLAPSSGGMHLNRDRPVPAAARKRVTKPPRRFSGFQSVAVALTGLVLVMVVIGKRTAVVMAAPRTAALYAAMGLPVNIRNLELGDIKTTRLDDGAQRVEISGRIRNLAEHRAALPRMTFDIRGSKGETLVTWSESAPKRALAGAETVPFTTQSPVLPDGYKDVVVRFTDAERDAPLGRPGA
jgi:predicted Zn finger-like uncharacterized protein